jgi:sugar phosphate isomerase/epimerase
MASLEVGVMMSVGWTMEQIHQIRDLGFTNVQIAAPPEEVLEDHSKRRELIDGLTASGVEVTTVFVGFAGESYADIPTVVETVGYLNPDTRSERVRKTERISDFAKELGVNKVAAHVGFVPEDAEDPAHQPMVDAVGSVADHCNANGQAFSLETGQETASALLHFLQTLGRDNVKVNFDPANMVLYGSGEPIEALGIVADHVISVHAKDGKWPTASGQLGTEFPLGQGDVGMDNFVAKLKEIGYTGPLTMEREIPDWTQKVKDLVAGKALLNSLK